jgi:ABC-type multidrug transport system ATPase subunit/pSer/pThr/pTyr-binding forkhead associated (FHA) protein
VLVDHTDGQTFINGERLIPGERRTLRRGDTVSIGGEMLHYLPHGAEIQPLRPIQPVDAGRVRATKQAFVIGRGPESDLVLDHPTVSREHAVIRAEPGRAVIEDRGSATGLRVNGEPVRRAILTAGDQIAIGPYRIIFDGEELVGRARAQGLPMAAFGVRVDVAAGTILQPTDVQLRPGELVAFVGESGAGKSTLLKALAGVTRPTQGRVLAGGEDVSARLTEIGYVPQFDIVHGQLTVREALDYAARLRLPADLSEPERATRVQEVIEQLGLAERADTRIDDLSGGQRKRAAVGTELLHRPGALFLDEPTTGLDPGLERRMMQLFRSFADSGQTVVVVTHATASISLCDRVVVMGRGGHVCFDGAPGAALEAFDVATFDEVYLELAGADPADVAARLAGRLNVAVPPVLPPLPGRGQRQIQQAWQYQTKVLASRYATILLRDRRHLRSVLVQVPILGLLTALLFTSDVFRQANGEEPAHVFAGKSAQLLFLMVTIAIWLGAINAAREIVKERSVLARELAIGVQVRAYLASKLVVLFVLATAQTLLFSLIVLTLRPLHEASGAGLHLVEVLVLSSWIAVLMGLLVSAYATSEDQATGVIPLLLVPQLLFGGAIVALHEMSAPLKVLAALIPARWGFAAAGHTVQMQQRIAEDPTFSQASHYGSHFFSVPLLGYVAISAAFVAAMFALLVRMLQQPQPL